MNLKEIIKNISEAHDADRESLRAIIENSSEDNFLFEEADRIRRENYGIDVYLRGLIEISNYCKNDCLYCGIRKSNLSVKRYRLEKDEILECCKTGYKLNFRTFVLQGGEDLKYTDDEICEIVSEIKKLYPQCAVTLSLGEKSFDTYKKYYETVLNFKR